MDRKNINRLNAEKIRANTINPDSEYPLGLSPDAMISLADLAGIGIWNWHIPSNDISLNEPIVKLMGYEMFEIPHSGVSRRSMIVEEDLATVDEYINDLLAGRRDYYQLSYRMRRRDGSIVSILENAFVYTRDESGKVLRIAAAVTDLSLLRQSEQKIRDLEKENRSLCEGMSNRGLSTQVHLLRAVNKAAADIVGGFYQNYEITLFRALKSLGESLGVCGIYLYRKASEERAAICYLRAAWRAERDAPIPGTADIAWDFKKILPEWEREVKRDAYFCYSGANAPESLSSLDDISFPLMFAPLYLHGAFWGVLRVDSFAGGRPLDEIEAEITITGVAIIASSISRSETLGKLNTAREEAMESARAKSEFLSNISHEIRTPMNAIIGMTAIARKSDDPGQVQYALEKIESSSKQLLAIINDVLDMSKIDSGRFEIVAEAFDFERMLRNTVNVIKVRMDEKRQVFKIEMNKAPVRHMVADEIRLSQVLINLLSNAVRFTPEEGIITLKIGFEPLPGDEFRLTVEVSDTGMGISKEAMGRLFVAFEQADSGISRKYGGTGLGLAISKRIISLMGGDIRVESEPGMGASFFFDITASWGEPLPSITQIKRCEREIRVLAADGDDDVREYFKKVINSFSQRCETARDGEEAIRLARRAKETGMPFDIFFMDWNLPGKAAGPTAAALIRELGADTPIVAISVRDWKEIRSEVNLYGIRHFLPKPILPSMLYNTILDLVKCVMAKPITAEVSAAPNWKGKTILLAEDIEVNREIIAVLLEDTAADIIFAVNGEEAVRALEREQRPDLILMDLQMPVMDGLSATGIIRSMNSVYARTVPIVAMTANAFKEDRDLCLKAGMNDHLSKPIEVEVLFNVLKKYLGA